MNAPLGTKATLKAEEGADSTVQGRAVRIPIFYFKKIEMEKKINEPPGDIINYYFFLPERA